mgnify:CR=1 FL=1
MRERWNLKLDRDGKQYLNSSRRIDLEKKNKKSSKLNAEEKVQTSIYKGKEIHCGSVPQTLSIALFAIIEIRHITINTRSFQQDTRDLFRGKYYK